MLFRPEKWSFRKVQKIARDNAKGLVHVFVKKWNFFMMWVFLADQFGKDRFLIFSIKKERFLDQKKQVLKKCKTWKFSKGISPRFLSINRTFYHVCFLGQIYSERWFFNLLDKKRILFRLEKLSLKKVQKIGIPQRGQFIVFIKKSKFL